MSKDNDNKMGFKELVGGTVVGAGVGYAGSAISGRKLNKLKFTDLAKEGSEIFNKGSKEIVADVTKFAQEYKLAERGIKPNDIQAAISRSSIKIAEKLGLDPAEVLRDMKKTNLNPEHMADPAKMQEYFVESIEIAAKQWKQLLEKLPTVAGFSRHQTDSMKIMADTFAETIGMAGAEREKFAKDFTSLLGKHTKSAYSALESTGRKIIGAVKHEHAAWYEKPIVAFEAMSTRGKIGLGAAVAASTLVAAFAINRLSRPKDSDQTAPSR